MEIEDIVSLVRLITKCSRKNSVILAGIVCNEINKLLEECPINIAGLSDIAANACKKLYELLKEPEYNNHRGNKLLLISTFRTIAGRNNIGLAEAKDIIETRFSSYL